MRKEQHASILIVPMPKHKSKQILTCVLQSKIYKDYIPGYDVEQHIYRLMADESKKIKKHSKKEEKEKIKVVLTCNIIIEHQLYVLIFLQIDFLSLPPVHIAKLDLTLFT